VKSLIRMSYPILKSSLNIFFTRPLSSEMKNAIVTFRSRVLLYLKTHLRFSVFSQEKLSILKPAVLGCSSVVTYLEFTTDGEPQLAVTFALPDPVGVNFPVKGEPVIVNETPVDIEFPSEFSTEKIPELQPTTSQLHSTFAWQVEGHCRISPWTSTTVQLTICGLAHAAVMFALPAEMGVKDKVFGGIFSMTSSTGVPSRFFNIQKP